MTENPNGREVWMAITELRSEVKHIKNRLEEISTKIDRFLNTCENQEKILVEHDIRIKNIEETQKGILVKVTTVFTAIAGAISYIITHLFK